MTALHIVLTVIQVILAVALVAIVTIQSGKSAGLSSAIGGGSGESFLSKNKGKVSMPSSRARPSGPGAAFLILTFVLNLL